MIGGPNRSLEARCAGPHWHELSSDAAVHACRTYGVSQVWAPTIAACTLGIIEVESRFGTSERYRAKVAVRRVLSHPTFLLRLGPRAQGIAQIDQDRVTYLADDAALNHELDVWSPDGAVEATALGLAKAVSLHYPAQEHRPSRAQRANVVITHNAGWMTPRVARLQEVLVKLGFLQAETQRNGFAGPRTLAALDLAASHLGRPTLAQTMHANEFHARPAWGLTHPDLAPMVRRSTLFESLQHAASSVGESLDEPRFPDYRVRRWYTGWISSPDYARAVLLQAEVWRKKSTTSLGGSSSSNAKYRVL